MTEDLATDKQASRDKDGFCDKMSLLDHSEVAQL